MLGKADVEAYARRYRQRRWVVVPDFLGHRFAAEVHEGLIDLDARGLWYRSRRDSRRQRKPYELSYSYWKYPLKHIWLSKLLEDSERKGQPHHASRERFPERELARSHPLRRLGDYWNSREAHRLIRMITGNRLSGFSAICFASKYGSGDFLGSHDDGAAPRRVAFSLNLTKKWPGAWGGGLVMHAKPEERVIRPRFNTLVLFDVPLAHEVTKVSADASRPRFAVSGWYHKFSVKEAAERTRRRLT